MVAVAHFADEDDVGRLAEVFLSAMPQLSVSTPTSRW